ncbi:MAG: hypothetical protein Q8M83_04985 [bacterium]|nr:hypothetical protein [bacterium]
MKKNTKNLIISLVTAIFFSFLFIFAANNKEGVTNFDIYLGVLWVFVLSFIVALSLVHIFKSNK